MKTKSNVTRKIESENVVVFHNRPKPKGLAAAPANVAPKREKRRRADNDEDEGKPKKESEDENFLTFKQAKYDVFKFGIKGFGKKEQEDAKAQLAIKLGAKPKKNDCVNYKELLEKQKQEKAFKEQMIQEHRLFEAKLVGNKGKKSSNRARVTNSNRKSKINRGQVGQIKGHIGSFSNGVLKLRKNDLRKLNAK